MDITPTPAGWLESVLADFDAFLKDHASCEKKASGMALNIASHYPDKPELLNAMTDLAVEELNHYREVVRLLIQRGLTPGPDQRDPYIRAMNGLIRRGPEHYLLDRLLIAAIVERRGNERFGLIAAALDDRLDDCPKNCPKNCNAAAISADRALATFYRAITASEARHWVVFLELAERYTTEDVSARLTDLLAAEADIMLAQPFRPALH